MKRNLWKFAAILSAGLAIASCQKEEPENTDKGGNEGEKQEQVGESITLEISAEGQWTEADVLGINIPAVQVSNKAASYENGKFKVSVPTPAKDDVVYAYLPFSPTTTDGKFNITIPSAVTDNNGTVKAKVASPVSLGEITNPMLLTMSMKDVAGTVQFNITDATESGKLAGQTITSLVVTSEADLAGTVSVDIKTGNTDISDASKTVTITPAEGTALGNGPVALKISALPGTYTGTITLTTSAAVYNFPLNTTVIAGQTASVELGCTAFEYKGIQTVEDWNAFIAGVIAGSYDNFVNPETGAVELAADLVFEDTPSYPGTEANSSIEFNGTFDGMDYEITCNKFTRPLFNFLGKDAVVKNLRIKGTYTEMMNSGICGNAVIAKVNKGNIENVSSYVNSELTIANGFIFGAICGQNGGIIKNCKNYGNMTLTYAASGNSGLYGGGIAALGHTVSGEPTATALNIDDTCTPGQFINCENYGNINVSAISGKPVRQGFGGICGLVYMNGVKFEGCSNAGNISRVSNGETSNNFSASVGGILGRSAAWYRDGNGDSGALDTSVMGFDTEITDCSNSGTLYCLCRHSGGITATGSCARADGIGGIAGTLIGSEGNIQKITNCTNTGDVTGGWNANVNTAALGGLVGIASYTEISGSSAICKVTSKANEYIGAAGGIVACVMNAVTVDNCIAKPTMDIYAYTGKPFFYGLLFGNIKDTATVKSASVGGAITADSVILEITSENFANHLISAKSNTQLSTTTGVSWAD